MEPLNNPAQPPATPEPSPAPAPIQNFSPPPATNNGYIIQLEIDYPEHQSRLMALLSLPFFLIRLILLIPHLIIIYILTILIWIIAWINFWAILFTGHSSKGMHSFMVGVTRWSTRINAYMYGLTDKYPPFSLS